MNIQIFFQYKVILLWNIFINIKNLSNNVNFMKLVHLLSLIEIETPETFFNHVLRVYIAAVVLSTCWASMKLLSYLTMWVFMSGILQGCTMIYWDTGIPHRPCLRNLHETTSSEVMQSPCLQIDNGSLDPQLLSKYSLNFLLNFQCRCTVILPSCDVN